MSCSQFRAPTSALLVSLSLLVTPLAVVLVQAPTRAVPPDRSSAAETLGLHADAAPAAVNARRTGKRTEVGMRFSAKVKGNAVGIQVFKASPRKKATPRRASLWDPAGVRVASVPIKPTRATGWITVTLPEPVKLLTNRGYTVSVFAKNGEYAVTRGAFTRPILRDGLRAPGHRNGVMRLTRRSAMPDTDRNSANYWVDVVFAPSGKQPPTPPPSPPTDVFPSPATAGTPAGWAPVQTIQGSHTVSQAGAVVQDLRINGNLIVDAPNVTLRRVDIVGGQVSNFIGGSCQPGLVVEDSTIRRSTGPTSASDEPALAAGGYTARRVELEGVPEGFRVGGRASGCGPVVIEDSYARVVRPDACGDWHGDGIQGYDGPALTIRRTTMALVENGCGGTAPFFYPRDQGNTSVDIDGLLLSGGGYSFRLGMPGRVRNLAVEDGSWHYGPINVRCSVLTEWSARIVKVVSPGVVSTVRAQPCNTEEGN